MSLQLVTRLVVALAIFGSAWQIQDWRYGAKEAAHAQQTLANTRQNAAVAVRRLDNIITAEDAATVRAAALRRDADGVRVALVGLHDSAADALRAAGESQAACLAHAATLSELFNASAARYGEVAGKADGHASDVKTLTDAWPQ